MDQDLALVPHHRREILVHGPLDYIVEGSQFSQGIAELFTDPLFVLSLFFQPHNHVLGSQLREAKVRSPKVNEHRMLPLGPSIYSWKCLCVPGGCDPGHTY